MSERRDVDIFSVLILVISIIAIVLVIIGPFAGFYYWGYGNRYSCLYCDYWTAGDLIAQIFILILFMIQMVIALNDLVPKKFISFDLTKYNIYIAITTFALAIIGLISFGVIHIGDEWWADLGFYGSVVGGILNSILFFLKQKNI
ncbi:MAG: hypothetical protein ACFE78_00210 [Candidatus Hodarchaeota archaeon]